MMSEQQAYGSPWSARQISGSPPLHQAPSPPSPCPPATPTLSYPRYLLSAMAAAFPSPSQLLSPHAATTPTSVGSDLSLNSPDFDAPGPSSPRGWRSRDFWGSPKHSERHDFQHEPMQVDEEDPRAFSFTYPPSLPQCSLQADFQTTDCRVDVPPAFYPGQSIPTVLTFQLDRYSSLPHTLNSTLTMSLVGTLHTPHAPSRTIISVSVSLAEGLALWARDAQQAYAQRQTESSMLDPAMGLPGGTYSLPLTVQVPSTPRLPPTFTVPNSSFAVTYALTVSLTCDDQLRRGGRIVLAEAARAFEMMPETLPTRAPVYNDQSFYVRTDRQTDGGVIGTAKGLVRRANTRWTIKPAIQTTTYSPTSTIPLKLVLTPPAEPVGQTYHVLVRIALIRREHFTNNADDLRDRDGRKGLAKEEEILHRYAWFESHGESIDIANAHLPIMHGETAWAHGYSTVLNVGPPPNSPGADQIAVSSTFHVATTMAFLAVHPEEPALDQLVGRQLLPMGQWSPPISANSPNRLSVSNLKRKFPGAVRTLPLPVVIGSVSEPRGAMYMSSWWDLQLVSNGEREIGRVIEGEAITSENGWIDPPPCYGDAVKEVPYEW